MDSFIVWLQEEALKRKGRKMASNTIIKEVERSGMSITKDKLIEMIKKSSQTTFSILQNPNSKEAVVLVNL
jgi:hypothetical protein